MSELPMAAASLEALRAAGACELDPARFRYLEALARRAGQQPEAVRRVLQEKLQAAVADYAERFARSRELAAARPSRARAKAVPAPACAPLAQLNAYIRTATAAEPGATADEAGELASVQRFREAWTRSRTHERVDEASARKPAHAGPLNSHVLVLQSLSLMRELSPGYLRHFLAHVESLQWLEQARGQYPRASVKGRTASRGRKK